MRAGCAGVRGILCERMFPWRGGTARRALASKGQPVPADLVQRAQLGMRPASMRGVSSRRLSAA